MKSRILLVDDNHENLVALAALLRREDAQIHTARSGVEALEMILQHEFALALLDVQMPQMDGFELAQMMRGAERSKYIPIIFLTAGAADAQRVFDGYETGAVDFLFKPPDVHILHHKVEAFILLDQQRKQLALQYEQLQASEAALREAVQARDDVLAVVSHDIRNFLQAIKGGVRLLTRERTELAATDTALVHARIGSTVDLMERVIADLLDMASIRQGRIPITPQSEPLMRLVDEALSIHDWLAQQKGVRLQREHVQDAQVSCDRQRILQVFANLLGNAIKFCRSGDEIRVCARLEDGAIRVDVTDSGPGIQQDHLSQVFDAYWSGDTGRGTGLGLYITRRIVEAHGQRIWIDSEPGRGTTVSFTLGTD